jgi:hypothetical protein
MVAFAHQFSFTVARKISCRRADHASKKFGCQGRGQQGLQVRAGMELVSTRLPESL